MRPFTLSNTNISETSWVIIIKFHLEQTLGGGLAALGFRPDRIKTLVSNGNRMIAHIRLSRGNLVTTLASSFLIGSSLFLQVTRTTINSRMGSKFGKITHRTVELAALKRLEKSP